MGWRETLASWLRAFVRGVLWCGVVLVFALIGYVAILASLHA